MDSIRRVTAPSDSSRTSSAKTATVSVRSRKASEDIHLQFVGGLFASLALLWAAASVSAYPIRFLTGPQQGDAFDIAWAYIQANHEELGLTVADLEDVVVRDRYVTQHNGVTHIYLQQRLGGIEVYNGILNVNVARDGSLISMGSNFVSDLASKVNAGGPLVSDRVAIEKAAAHYDLTPSGLILLKADGDSELRSTFSDAALSRDEIPARLVYQPVEGGMVRLAWETMLNLVKGSDWWSVRVDANTGEVLDELNFTNSDSYFVIPLPPFSDPEDSGGFSQVDDPADLTASPFGWHDTDGMAGGEFTDTRGNNVNAQEDLDANNSGGFRPDCDMGGSMLECLFPWDPNMQPDEGGNISASINNLFYGNNVMHDLTYQYGFDEPAGNFQANNYGNGGLGGDQVEADALDGSGTNNATFSTPPDGVSPRMTCLCWLSILNANIEITAPPEIAGDYIAGRGNWGGALTPPISGDFEVVDDGSGGTASQGCGALVGFTPGNIALIDRGSCEFGTKALNAETAGAVGAIIINDQQLPNGIITMGPGADGGAVTIPAVMIGSADGDTIRGALAALGGSVTGNISEPPSTPIARDSALDNGIIAHEYGHGISIRLTGGPSAVGCLNGSEQAGEGWSDFWTLVLTAKDTDTAELPKGVGNYVIFEPVNGPGIRNFPYTTDLSLNPQTYSDIAATNVPHGVGEIWMSMLWEVYWNLVDKHGFDTDFYNGTGGNNMTIQLVVDGLKLQGCLPDFVEARDAILMADMVNNGAANQCEIWRGFAKRGLGENAVAGNPNGAPNVGDETEDFTVPANCSGEPDPIFADGFESGDTTAWTTSVPFQTSIARKAKRFREQTHPMTWPIRDDNRCIYEDFPPFTANR